VPLTLWLAMPWRLFYRSVLRVSMRLAGRQPLGLVAVIVLGAFTLAVVQASEQHAWGTVSTPSQF
jgi:hypothetical protein